MGVQKGTSAWRDSGNKKGPTDKMLTSFGGDVKHKANAGSKCIASLQEKAISTRDGRRKFGTGDRTSRELTVCHLPSLSSVG